jgi:hypothetical protein
MERRASPPGHNEISSLTVEELINSNWMGLCLDFRRTYQPILLPARLQDGLRRKTFPLIL